MKKLILFGILLFSVHIYSDNLDDYIESWINNTTESEVLIQNLIRADQSIKQQVLLGKYLFITGDSDGSLTILEPLYKQLQKDLKTGERAELYSYASEVGTYIMIQKGVRFIISNSKKVNTYAEIALELNPELVQAEIIVLSGLINAPKLFGGDRERGIKGLKAILKRESITDLERYETLSTLLTTTKDEQEIEFYTKEIKKIYPGYSPKQN